VNDAERPRWSDRLLRGLLTRLHQRLRRRRGGAHRPGVHAAALTPEGRLILVKLRYAVGWRLPGGGRGLGETLETAALRELREEIGLLSHGAITISGGLVIVAQVRYRPRWSWEVERTMEAPLDALPSDLSPRARMWIASILPDLTSRGTALSGLNDDRFSGRL
jgi:ADP-ribose pyrophosphatase YjhB (NUDIX family)